MCALQRPAKDGSMVALRGRRCSYPGPSGYRSLELTCNRAADALGREDIRAEQAVALRVNAVFGH